MKLNDQLATWGRYYWPVMLSISFIAFLIPEIIALINNWRNTLSNWVWTILNVTKSEPISNWSALDFLAFGIWCVVATWLTFHFFLRKFT